MVSKYHNKINRSGESPTVFRFFVESLYTTIAKDRPLFALLSDCCIETAAKFLRFLDLSQVIVNPTWLVNPREFESLFHPWKGCVLTVRRWVHKTILKRTTRYSDQPVRSNALQYGAFRETRTPNLLITNQLHYQLCYEGETVIPAPTPAEYQWLPTQEDALRNLTQETYFFKQQEQSRRTLNSYSHYTV